MDQQDTNENEQAVERTGPNLIHKSESSYQTEEEHKVEYTGYGCSEDIVNVSSSLLNECHIPTRQGD